MQIATNTHNYISISKWNMHNYNVMYYMIMYMYYVYIAISEYCLKILQSLFSTNPKKNQK